MIFKNTEIKTIDRFIGCLQNDDEHMFWVRDQFMKLLDKQNGKFQLPSFYVYEFLNQIADTLGVSVDDVQTGSRDEYLVMARRIFVWYAKKHLHMEAPEMTQYIHRTRTMILSYIRDMDDAYNNNRLFMTYMDIFCQKMNIKYEALN